MKRGKLISMIAIGVSLLIVNTMVITIPCKVIVAQAAEEKRYGEFRYEINGSYAKITGFIGGDETVEIPSMVKDGANSYIVNSVANSVFYENMIKTLKVPSTITEIGDSVLGEISGLEEIIVDEGNKNFKSIDGVLYDKTMTTILAYPNGKRGKFIIPEGVTSIGKHGFYKCWSLSEVEFPSSLKSIGDLAFEGCSSIKDIVIPKSITQIGKGAFCDNSGLSEINVDKDNKNYISKDGLLYDKEMTKLIQCPSGKKEKVIIAKGIRSVEDYAFYGCFKLLSVDLPESLNNIGSCAFENCESLTDIKLPKALCNIGWAAFMNCSSLTSIDIPKRVTDLKGFSFRGCSKLSNISLSEELRSIGEYAFYECYNLSKIEIPKSVERQVKKLSPQAKKSYNKAIEALKSGDTRGFHDHALTGGRSGQRSVDIKGIGKGRGQGRIVYEKTSDGGINIIEIITKNDY